MADITTKSGFKAKISKDAMDNWDLLESFREIDRGNMGAIVDVAPVLLGEEQFKALKDHLRNDKGVLKASDMVSAIYEIIEGVKAIKKS